MTEPSSPRKTHSQKTGLKLRCRLGLNEDHSVIRQTRPAFVYSLSAVAPGASQSAPGATAGDALSALVARVTHSLICVVDIYNCQPDMFLTDSAGSQCCKLTSEVPVAR